ncbi:hypothetical protein [Nonomuraea insulae]|uniref:Uncharacterized protein n=1 Tax=Nonomuraea insulae TaxID=1616787 RepID=A0ABW1DA63_9ACTN
MIVEMVLTNQDRPIHAADRVAVIQAWLRLDVRDRQLSVLRNTFPNWDISYALDPAGHWIWSAVARQELTLEMATAGAVRKVHSGDPVNLMAALTYQAWLVERATRPHP